MRRVDIYIIRGHQGEYSDYNTSILKAYRSFVRATDVAKKLAARLKRESKRRQRQNAKRTAAVRELLGVGRLGLDNEYHLTARQKRSLPPRADYPRFFNWDEVTVEKVGLVEP